MIAAVAGALGLTLIDLTSAVTENLRAARRGISAGATLLAA